MNSTSQYVARDDELREACAALAKSNICAIDTEFVWDRTYAPQLGLIQIATAEHCFLIDPLPIADLTPLAAILSSERIEKIFHASSMDLRILSEATGKAVAPIFDSQVAAALLGYGNQTSYSFLVEQFLGVVVDKSETYTDWLQRPLTQKQLDYAARDVTHLLVVYEHLKKELLDRGRLQWAIEEFAVLSGCGHKPEVDPRELYRTVRRCSTLDGRGLAVLRELAEWRDAEARRRNVRPAAVMRDETMVETARRRPSTPSALSDIRGLDGREVRRNGDLIVSLIKKGQNIPEAALPIPPERSRTAPTTMAAVDLLWAVVLAKATVSDVSPELLSSRSELRQLVEMFPSQDGELDVLKGWRHEIVGGDLLDLLEHKKSLAFDGAAGVRLVDLP